MHSSSIFVVLFALGGCLAIAACSPASSTRIASSSEELSLRRQVVQYARRLEGARYRYGGRGPKAFDCSGFTHYVWKRYGVELPTVSAAQEQVGRAVAVKEVQPGDLLLFRRSRSGRVFHVALVTANRGGRIRMIHSTSSRGVVEEELQASSYWRSKHATARSVAHLRR